jgi:exopolysaccharide biosynthesis polyprenyl glycosylphosphotransferase
MVHAARRRGSFRHTVLIAGTPGAVDDVARVLRRERQLGYRVAGALTPDGIAGDETSSGIPVVGPSAGLTDTVRELGADVVFFADGAVASTDEMRQIAWNLEHDAVQVIVAPSVSDVASDRVRVRPVGGLPLIHIDPPRVTDASRWGKRLFDIVGASALLVLLAPVFAACALRIKLHDRGPVLFRQTRVGRNGERFGCLKFRTMVVDAEGLLAQLHTFTGYSSGLFKMKDDPRITKPGRLLRRFSIDEFPQLVNVLRGEMSLVGPRPPLPMEVAQYSNRDARRLRVRPGLTGLWQVSGRSDLSWDEAIRLDLYYVDNWSVLQDLSILAKTLSAVLRSRGAY